MTLAKTTIIFWLALFCMDHAIGAAAAIQDKEKMRPNILWLTAEDIGPHLGCYGDQVAKTPNLDALARKGMKYQTAWSNYPVCAPARTTIITGCYAASFGAGHMRCRQPLPGGVRMFPSLLRESGYYCTNNSKEDFNLTKRETVWDRNGRKAHYKKRNSKPFFSVFNFTGTHESQIRNKKQPPKTDLNSIQLPAYYPDEKIVRKDWANYYDNIARLDKWVGEKLAELKRSGLEDETIVVFFGDHGSGMPRHKRYAGDSGMRVPLVVYVPSKFRNWAGKNFNPGGTSQQMVGFVDLAPTMLSLTGSKVPDYMQGKAFLGPVASTKSKKYLFGFRSRMDESVDCSRSVTDGKFVYIRNYMPHIPHGQILSYQQKTPTTSLWLRRYQEGALNSIQSKFWQPRPREELYDLRKDPWETKNLASEPKCQKDLQRFGQVLFHAQTETILDLEMNPEFATAGTNRWARLRGIDRLAAKEQLKRVIRSAELSSEKRTIQQIVRDLQRETIGTGEAYWISLGLLQVEKTPSSTELGLLKELLGNRDAAAGINVAEFLLENGSDQTKALAAETLSRLAVKPDKDYQIAFLAIAAMVRTKGNEAWKGKAISFPAFSANKSREKKYWGRLVQQWRNSK